MSGLSAALAAVFAAEDLRGEAPVVGFLAEDLPVAALAGAFEVEDRPRLVPRGGVSESTDFAARAFLEGFTGAGVFPRFDAGREDCFVEERGSRAGLMRPGL
ncbi:hypothetical protein ACN47A_08315 [Myxococcus fulvus]|uniref:hypothetical protein n=1 Tax=Myxococcus fulvus TaxID=33 RepID=UPI003B9C681E